MIPESLYTDWMSKNIAEYFKSVGFRVRYAGVSQRAEAVLPFDRMYSFTSPEGPFSLFALQFKAPRAGANGLLVFDLDLEQLRKLQQPLFANWVLYAFPFFTRIEFQDAALHLVNFTRPLQIPSLKSRSHFPLHWRAPFLMIERAKGADGPEPEELEPHKVFDTFSSTGKNDLVLTRRACTLSDGTLRYEIPHVSWGELFQSLSRLSTGRHFLKPEDIESFVNELSDHPIKAQNSVLVALDHVRHVIEVIALLPETQEGGNSTDSAPTF